MEGWIKIGREISGHWLWEDAERLKWWLDLLLLAACKPSKQLAQGTLVEIGRGQVIVSIRHLQDRWAKRDKKGQVICKPSKTTISSFLSLLEEDNKIVVKNEGHRYTILTICNYEHYANCRSDNRDTDRDTDRDTIGDTDGDTDKIEPQINTQEDSQNESKVGTPIGTPIGTPTKSAQTIPLYKNILSSRNYSTISRDSKIEDSKINIKERNVNVKKEIRGADVPAKDEHPADAKSSSGDKPPVKGKTKRERFAEQVERSTNRGYKAFGKWLLENAPNILDGRTSSIEPPTEKEYVNLWVTLSEYEVSDNELKRYVLQIENNRVYLSRYKTLHLTIGNWVKHDGGQQKRIN